MEIKDKLEDAREFIRDGWYDIGTKVVYYSPEGLITGGLAKSALDSRGGASYESIEQGVSMTAAGGIGWNLRKEYDDFKENNKRSFLVHTGRAMESYGSGHAAYGAQTGSLEDLALGGGIAFLGGTVEYFAGNVHENLSDEIGEQDK